MAKFVLLNFFELATLVCCEKNSATKNAQDLLREHREGAFKSGAGQ